MLKNGDGNMQDENHAKEDNAEEMIDNVPPANPPPETNMQIDQPVDADEGDDEEEEEGQIVGPGDNMVPSNF